MRLDCREEAISFFEPPRQPGVAGMTAPAPGLAGATDSDTSFPDSTSIRRPSPVTLLSGDVASKIAAGECVDRPASVVKELVENAIDAGATRIVVEMTDGGREMIRVQDNGCGMSQEDLVLSVQRHATSKIRDLGDLAAIQTLGFRGEALPSIAAVSRLEITSCVAGDTPNRIEIEGGDVTALSASAAPTGTMVTVRDLFYNTPARLKFLRSAQTEFGHALEHLTRLAIAHHHVAFRVIHNRREALNTPGSPDPLNAIVAAYGPDTARGMIRVDAVLGAFRVHGYVSLPSLSRSNRNQQAFFVNRRCVRNRTIGHALDQAYRTLLTVGRHPVAALLLEVPPETVDVNVHPTKAEVRFVRESEVHQAVARAVRDTLLASNLVPDIPLDRTGDGASSSPMVPSAVSPGDPRAGDRLFSSVVRTTPPESREWMAEDELSSVAPGPGLSGFDYVSIESASPRPDSGAFSTREVSDIPFIAPLTAPSSGPLDTARVVGQLHRCYIVAETQQGIVLIDQHAAHERVLYEKFLSRSSSPQVQSLLVPLTLTVAQRDAALIQDRLEEFRQLGFEMEPFGPGVFLVRTSPLFSRRVNLKELLQDLVDEVAGADFSRRLRLRYEQIAASMACRAAIKQGDTLDFPEMEALLNDLRSVDRPLDVPTNCPHGRPTTILLTLSQVERFFQRT